jgi:hypothetical protein
MGDAAHRHGANHQPGYLVMIRNDTLRTIIVSTILIAFVVLVVMVALS